MREELHPVSREPPYCSLLSSALQLSLPPTITSLLVHLGGGKGVGHIYSKEIGKGEGHVNYIEEGHMYYTNCQAELPSHTHTLTNSPAGLSLGATHTHTLTNSPAGLSLGATHTHTLTNSPAARLSCPLSWCYTHTYLD